MVRRWSKKNALKQEEKEFSDSLVEFVDLKKVAGKYSPQLPFFEIRRIMFYGQEVRGSNGVLFTEFVGGAALTNGIQIFRNNRNLTPLPITNNARLKGYKFDMDITNDGGAVKTVVMTGRLTFDKINRVKEGLRMRELHNTLIFKLNDDLSGRFVEFGIFVEGWVV